MKRLPAGGWELFLAIAEQGSLRKAAALLGVRPPAVSYRLKALEERIGVTLFTRTTRSVRLTDAGRALLRRIQPAMAELSEALEEARGLGRARKGTIRISLPYVAHELTLAPRLAAFRREYPEVLLELSFEEAFVDIVAEGFHAGVRMGDHIHADMIAVRLSPPFKEAHFAAPAYLERRGRPQRPQDLLGHDCIRYRLIGSKRMAEWQFRGPAGPVSVQVDGGLVVNNTNALLQAARDGLGIGWLFAPSIDADVTAGRLARVLESYALERPGFFLYYPRANARLEILRLFVEFMRDHTSARRRRGRRAPPAP
jgi:DNA-binding transcriptional LysR family regulator